MQIELRSFTGGISFDDWVNNRVGAHVHFAPRSNILIEGRWVGHVGWDENEEIVFCREVTPAEKDAVRTEVERKFGNRRPDQTAAPSLAEPVDRRKKKVMVPGQEEDE